MAQITHQHTTFETGQTAADASDATQLPNTDAKRVVLSNLDGSTNIYIGNSSSVTSSNGHELVAGSDDRSRIELFLGNLNQIWIAADSGTPTLGWLVQR